MNKRFLFITFLIVLGIGNLAFCQIKKVKKQMTLYNYSEALSILDKSLKKEKIDKREATLLMAECYLKQNDVQSARGWYAKAIEYGVLDSSTLFNYAQVLRSCGDYEKAKETFLRYDQLFPGDPRVIILAGYCDTATVWKDLPPRFELKNAVTLNSKQSEFGPVLYNDQLCYTSDRILSKKTYNKYGWTGNAFLHLYFADPSYIDDFYQGFKEIRLAPDLFNKAYHDGPASFRTDGSEVLFNRTLLNKDKGKTEQDRIRTHLLKIFSSERKNSKWEQPTPFFLNNDNYSIGHPALSKDGNELYFTSDMPGGYGGTDLYVCRRVDENWSQPVNLGPVINTFGNEMFPYASDAGDLYFASDGHPGFGGLDIFVTHLVDSTWSFPQNLNQPINSSFDDFSFFISKDNLQGLLSSNRPGGLGSDDLYHFRRLPEPEPEPVILVPFLSGYVKDKISLNPIDTSTVFIFDKITGQVLVLKTDTNGFYKTEIIPGRRYVVKAMQTGYIADCYIFTTETSTNVIEQTAPRDLLLDILLKDKVFALENIYYDLNKWNIRPDAEPALDNLVSIMKENPANIELGSHTDCRASNAYNLDLSQKRAESAVRYIILQGINPDRITAKGYGEIQLVNKCKDGVPCTEEEHQQNRRTEFKVISSYEDVRNETFNLSRFRKGEKFDAGLLPENFFDKCK